MTDNFCRIAGIPGVSSASLSAIARLSSPMMRAVSTLVSLAGVVFGSHLVDVSTVSNGCTALSARLSDAVFFKNSSVYQYEAQEFWSNTEKMSPSCVFRPQSSQQLAKGLESLVDAEAKFAVRGGGHMGIRVGNIIDQ